MLFNSFIFIFLFLPLTLIGWYGLNKIKFYKGAQAFLTAMSLWFYAFFNISYLPIIIISCLINYASSFIMTKNNTDTFRRLMCAAGCIFNLGVLWYYKYYDFFIENINTAFSTQFNLKHILLPLGISFFTFQQLSFVIDRSKGSAPHYNLLDYLNFVTFFPQLIAGPIALHDELIPQFHNLEKRRFDIDLFAEGIAFFVIGLAKKVLLADTLIEPIEYGFTHVTGLDTPTAFIVMIAYTFEIYFDFSGYCDMATGIGKMFCIELPDNFNSPYKSTSIKELWRRWHITLGRFFTTYVYIPLGGSRKGKRRTAINTLIVFLLSGLWHGASWTFVFWGLMQGTAIAISVFFPAKNNINSIKKKFLAIPTTFIYFSFSLIFFRSDNMKNAIIYIKQMFSFCYSGRMFIMADTLDCPEMYIVTKLISMKAPELVSMANFVILLIILAVCIFALSRSRTRVIVENSRWTRRFALVMAALFAWSVISLSGVSTFLYFNF